jgi:hypothetical protein
MRPNLTSNAAALLLMGLYTGVCAAGGVGAHAATAPTVTMHQNFQFPATAHDVRWEQRPLSEEALKQLAHLRAESEVLLKLDGGKLTRAHRDYLQGKLEAIHQSAR